MQAAVAVAGVELDCNAYDCRSANRLDSESCAILPQQFAAIFASEYSYPYKLQMIGHHDRATPQVVSPSAGAFALTPQNPVYPFSII